MEIALQGSGSVESCLMSKPGSLLVVIKGIRTIVLRIAEYFRALSGNGDTAILYICN